MISVAELMAETINPEQLVAVDTENCYNWRDFRGAVVALVNTLSEYPQGRWLLYTENSYQFAVGLMALLHTGNTVLLPINAQSGTLQEWVSQCEGMLGVESGLGIPLRGSTDRTFQKLDPGSCFIEVVTSGSTGNAQVIRKPLSCFQLELQSQFDLWQQALKESTVFATVSQQHIYGLLFRLMLPLCSGRPFWASSHQYPELLMADIARHGESAVLISSPAHLGRLPPSLDLTAASKFIKMVTSSGGPLPFDAAQDVQHRFGLLPIEILGSTETGGIAWRQQTEPDQPWQPLPGVELDVDPKNHQLRVYSAYCTDGNDGYTGSGSVTMGDVVDLFEDGRFLLKGRADRIVKIEGKRLSLTAMEQHLQASPWVAAAKLLVLPGQRNQLAAVVELGSEGREMLTHSGKLVINKALKQHLLENYERVLLPRKWRYPKTMPVNSQGKIPLADLEALFTNSQAAEIQFQLISQTGEQCVFQAALSAENREFQGHFPELPILPGVVQLDRAIQLQTWYDLGNFLRVDKLKFKEMITPGTLLRLTITHAGKGRVRFDYQCDEKPISSGLLVFREST